MRSIKPLVVLMVVLTIMAVVMAMVIRSEKRRRTNDPFGVIRSVEKNTMTIVGYRHRYESKVPGKISDQAKKLFENGVSYFLVEVPKGDEKEVRAIIDSTADKKTLEFYRIGYGKEFPEMLRALSKAGIRVAVEDLPYINGNPQDSSFREAHYAEVIGGLLKSKPEAKIVLLIGAFHAKPIKERLTGQRVTTGAIVVEEPD